MQEELSQASDEDIFDFKDEMPRKLNHIQTLREFDDFGLRFSSKRDNFAQKHLFKSGFEDKDFGSEESSSSQEILSAQDHSSDSENSYIEGSENSSYCEGVSTDQEQLDLMGSADSSDPIQQQIMQVQKAYSVPNFEHPYSFRRTNDPIFSCADWEAAIEEERRQNSHHQPQPEPENSEGESSIGENIEDSESEGLNKREAKQIRKQRPQGDDLNNCQSFPQSSEKILGTKRYFKKSRKAAAE